MHNSSLQKDQAVQSIISVSATIVVWNCRKWIKDCLDSILAQTYPVHEIIIIDNASEDNEREIIAGYHDSRIKYHRMENNIGFAAAQNAGIRNSSGEWILVMNPDVILDKEFLQRVFTFKGIEEKTGMITGKILRMDEDKKKTSIIDSTGVAVGVSRRMYDIGEGEKDISQFNKPQMRNAVSACCCLLRKAMLNEIMEGDSFFDEGLYMYYEDVDLCWRAYLANWGGQYVPDAIAYHKRGGSQKSTPSPFFKKLISRNRYVVIWKNDSLSLMLCHLPFIFIYEVILFLRILRYPYLFLVYYDAAKILIRGVTGHKSGRVTFGKRMKMFRFDFAVLLQRLFK